jgi:hypothetical protein
MLNEEFFVDTKKVAKQAKSAGEFMMMKCETGNLLVTGQFVLSLSSEQFFSVQCKLEVPKLGIWYMQTKEGLCKSEYRQPELELWEQRYNEWMNEADPNKVLTNTRLTLLDYSLYTDGNTYIAIKYERIEMLSATEDMRLAGKMVIVDGVHVIAPMADKVWQTNGWLYRLPGFEKEAEDEK